MIKAALIGSVAALSLVAGAIAARAADAIVEAPVVYDWSGTYIGGQIGGAFGDENDDLSDQITSGFQLFNNNVADDFSMSGFVGGVYGGVNYQLPNNVVLGFEGDFNGSSYKGSHDYDAAFDGTIDDIPGGGDFGIQDVILGPEESVAGTLKMESDWQASIRGRVGYAMDRTLIYGTAGVAFARAELTNEGTFLNDGFPEEEGGFRDSDTKTLVGYTVGIGIEHAFTDNWIGRLEGRYSDFGSKTFDLGDFGDVKADFNQGQVLVGISYKF